MATAWPGFRGVRLAVRLRATDRPDGDFCDNPRVSFCSEHLLETLRRWPRPTAYWVAYSGGLDSTVLLHTLAAVRTRLARPLHAVHAHHGWHAAADAWEAHCVATCRRLDLPLAALRLDLPSRRGESREAAARAARYAAFDRLLPAGAMLLTAHHRDDQAETVLLQLLRGAGPAGLAGIGELNPRRDGWIGRPLLDVERRLLHEYADRHGLSWVDDPSNAVTEFDRNYLRVEVLPRLRSRWPGLSAAVARSAAHCAAAERVGGEVARALFAADPRHAPHRLAIGHLAGLPPHRQALLLRHWLALSGLPVPDAGRLRRLLTEVAAARADAAPRIAWPGAEVRRFRDLLYAMPPLGPPPDDQCWRWAGGAPLDLPAGLGTLRLGREGLALPRAALACGAIEVRLGNAGAPAAPAGRTGRRSFKRLCQEWSVPPWVRPRLPLLYLDGHLAAVGDYGSCEPYAVAGGEPVVRLRWDRPAWLT